VGRCKHGSYRGWGNFIVNLATVSVLRRTVSVSYLVTDLVSAITAENTWSVAVVNPDPEVRSSGRVQSGIVHPSARPELRIRIRHWSIVATLFVDVCG
jgi:hypothetical protein